jgi:hypothetical protein
LVLLNRARASAFGELKEGCGLERRTKAQVKEVLEPAPARSALIILKLDILELGDVFQMVRSHPDLLLFHVALLVEVQFALIDEE